MALSGVRDQAYTVSDVISDALAKLYILEGGTTPDATSAATALRGLRNMLRTWAVDGVRLWLDAEQAITPVAGTATYTLTVRTLEVKQAFRRNAGSDTPIRLISREEYNRLPNKASTGNPFAMWVDRDRTSTSVTLYPVPDAASAANDTIYVTGKQQIQDVTDGAQDIDIPPEWSEALVYNLAVRLAPDFNVEVRPDVAGIAMELYTLMKGQDRELSVMMRPRRYR